MSSCVSLGILILVVLRAVHLVAASREKWFTTTLQSLEGSPKQCNERRALALVERIPVVRRRRTGKQAPSLPRSRRYDFDFWGKAGGRRKPGRKRKTDAVAADAKEEQLLAQTRANNERSVELCRALLVELDEEDLRRRLSESRYNRGGSARELKEKMVAHVVLDDRWLFEAVSASHVPP